MMTMTTAGKMSQPVKSKAAKHLAHADLPPMALLYDAHMQYICECHMGIIWYLMWFAPGFHMAYPHGLHMFSIWMTYDNRQMDTIWRLSAACDMSSIWNTYAYHVDMPYGNHMANG